jgi:uncharacterized membrane protein
MSQRHIQWLQEELPTLVSQGVLTTEAAERLRRYYSGREGRARGRSRAVVAFSILGAALVGSGIILLLAHNWDQMSRAMRTVISFTPLVCAQAVAAWVLWKRRDSPAWREGAGTALTLAIGATISLIAQTYNISGDFGGFMLTWTLLVLPVVYLLDASMPAVLYLAGITVWSADARISGGHPLWFWLLTALVLPHLWLSARKNRLSPRVAFVCWALALSLAFGTGICESDLLHDWWILIYAGVLAAMYLIGDRWFDEAAHWWQRPFQTVGGLGVFGLALFLTCRWPWHELMDSWKGNQSRRIWPWHSPGRSSRCCCGSIRWRDGDWRVRCSAQCRASRPSGISPLCVMTPASCWPSSVSTRSCLPWGWGPCGAGCARTGWEWSTPAC